MLTEYVANINARFFFSHRYPPRGNSSPPPIQAQPRMTGGSSAGAYIAPVHAIPTLTEPVRYEQEIPFVNRYDDVPPGTEPPPPGFENAPLERFSRERETWAIARPKPDDIIDGTDDYQNRHTPDMIAAPVFHDHHGQDQREHRLAGDPMRPQSRERRSSEHIEKRVRRNSKTSPVRASSNNRREERIRHKDSKATSRDRQKDTAYEKHHTEKDKISRSGEHARRGGGDHEKDRNVRDNKHRDRDIERKEHRDRDHREHDRDSKRERERDNKEKEKKRDSSEDEKRERKAKEKKKKRKEEKALEKKKKKERKEKEKRDKEMRKEQERARKLLEARIEHKIDEDYEGDEMERKMVVSSIDEINMMNEKNAEKQNIELVANELNVMSNMCEDEQNQQSNTTADNSEDDDDDDDDEDDEADEQEHRKQYSPQMDVKLDDMEEGEINVSETEMAGFQSNTPPQTAIDADEQSLDLYADIVDNSMIIDYPDMICGNETKLPKRDDINATSPRILNRSDSILDIHANLDFDQEIDEMEPEMLKKAISSGSGTSSIAFHSIPEPSKWERDEDLLSAGEKISGSDTSPYDDKSGSGKVTNEVLKRAENAIFARAINAIRPIEIKKISVERQKLYANEKNQRDGSPATSVIMIKSTPSPTANEMHSFQITVPVNSNDLTERSVEIKMDKPSIERAKTPVRSVKDRLGSKITDVPRSRTRTPPRKLLLDVSMENRDGRGSVSRSRDSRGRDSRDGRASRDIRTNRQRDSKTREERQKDNTESSRNRSSRSDPKRSTAITLDSSSKRIVYDKEKDKRENRLDRQESNKNRGERVVTTISAGGTERSDRNRGDERNRKTSPMVNTRDRDRERARELARIREQERSKDMAKKDSDKSNSDRSKVGGVNDKDTNKRDRSASNDDKKNRREKKHKKDDKRHRSETTDSKNDNQLSKKSESRSDGKTQIDRKRSDDVAAPNAEEMDLKKLRKLNIEMPVLNTDSQLHHQSKKDDKDHYKKRSRSVSAAASSSSSSGSDSSDSSSESDDKKRKKRKHKKQKRSKRAASSSDSDGSSKKKKSKRKKSKKKKKTKK